MAHAHQVRVLELQQNHLRIVHAPVDFATVSKTL